MKFIVWDLSNHGIIACTLTLAAANALRAGLIDTDLSYVFPGGPSYDKLTVGVQQEDLRWNLGTGISTPLEPHDINPVYVEKKRLAGVRIGAINKIVLFSIVAPRKTAVYNSAMAESDIEFSIERSDPVTGQYHDCITEYAHINRMPVEEAYKQLKLRNDNYRSERMRIYSFYDYFIGRINLIEDRQELVKFNADMDLILRKDLFIETHFFEGER